MTSAEKSSGCLTATARAMLPPELQPTTVAGLPGDFRQDRRQVLSVNSVVANGLVPGLPVAAPVVYDDVVFTG